MQPGTRWVYDEVGEQGEYGERLKVVVTVTSVTREIANGITARVVRDTVTQDGEVVEDTFDWYAPGCRRHRVVPRRGHCRVRGWHDRQREGSFEAGVDGALPGVIMPGKPADGMAYRQEYYAGEAEDNGEMLSTHEMADVPAGHYEDVVLTKDTITIEPDVLEYKIYAPEVGRVLVLGLSGGAGREELVQMTTVSGAVARKAGTAPLGTRYE